MDVATLIQEIQHMSAWVSAQLAAGMDPEMLATSQHQSIMCKLRMLRNLNFENSALLTAEINSNEGIGLTMDQKHSLRLELIQVGSFKLSSVKMLF